MGRFYGTKILLGQMTIDEVPPLWLSATVQWLEDNSGSKFLLS